MNTESLHPQKVPPRTIGNASTPPGSYVPPKWEPARGAAANQHQQYTSLPFFSSTKGAVS